MLLAATLAGPSEQLPFGLHDIAEHHRTGLYYESCPNSESSFKIGPSMLLSCSAEVCNAEQADLQEGCMLPPSKHLLVSLHDRVEHRHSPICAFQLLYIEGLQILREANDQALPNSSEQSGPARCELLK